MEHLDLNSLFWYSAIFGTGMFLVQTLINALGLFEMADDLEWSEVSFRIASKLTWTAFLMMFGWVGLAALHEFSLSPLFSLLTAIGVGCLTILSLTFILKKALLLKSYGTSFNLNDMVGKKATTYQKIPLNGVGKVTIVHNEIFHEIDAISPYQEEIPSFVSVTIIEKINETTVAIIPEK